MLSNMDIKPYELKVLDQTNYTEALEIYQTNNEYFMLTQGAEGTAEELLNSINALPKGFHPDDKLAAGIWKEGRIIGILDVVAGFPQIGCIWIGLLMLHGELRGKNMGGQIVDSLFDVFRQQGYGTVQLGVIDNNVKALNFWMKKGFHTISTSDWNKENIQGLKVLVMEKSLL